MLTSELLEEIRDIGSITPDVVDATLRRAADAEIRTRLLPLVRTLNEEYLVRTLDVTAVNGRIALPPRATGASVRMVQVVLNGQLSEPLPRLDPAKDRGTVAGGLPYGFYFDGGGIVLLPIGTTATCRVRYYARPGKLCDDADASVAALISAVTPGAVTTALTCVFTGSLASPKDIVSAGPAHQHVAISALITGPQPNLTVPTSSLLEQPGVGDYVVAADFSPFVALPEELGSTLALRTAARVLSNLGYLAEASAQYDQADQAQREAEALLRPRSDGNPKRLSGGTLARLSGDAPFSAWREW